MHVGLFLWQSQAMLAAVKKQPQTAQLSDLQALQARVWPPPTPTRELHPVAPRWHIFHTCQLSSTARLICSAPLSVCHPLLPLQTGQVSSACTGAPGHRCACGHMADDHATYHNLIKCNQKIYCLVRRAWASMRMLGTWLMTTPPTRISLKAYQACICAHTLCEHARQ